MRTRVGLTLAAGVRSVLRLRWFVFQRPFSSSSAAIGSVFTLTTIINAAVQSLAQVAAIVVLRHRQPNLPRPYRQWLYPMPTIAASACRPEVRRNSSPGGISTWKQCGVQLNRRCLHVD
jgi:hypothetical protein